MKYMILFKNLTDVPGPDFNHRWVWVRAGSGARVVV